MRFLPLTPTSVRLSVSVMLCQACQVSCPWGSQGKNPDTSAAVDYNPSTTILHNLNLNISMGSRCLLIRANVLVKSTLLRILGGRHFTHPDSDVRVLGLNSFRDKNLNFYCAYLDTNWGMCTVTFAGVSITLMADIPVYGMMEKLQRS